MIHLPSRLRFLLLGTTAILVFFISFNRTSSFTPTLKTKSWISKLSHQESAQEGKTIPNIAHYIWILDPKKENPTLEFQFKHFLSLYSTFQYLNPTIIYLHTNANTTVLSLAKANGTYWTRKIFQIPHLKVLQVEPPSTTNKGREIKALEHQSDFLRPSILHSHGGIYIDFDIIPLRSFSPLLSMGFSNVFGHELWEKVNNGLMMSVKGSRLMRIYDKEQHEFYDGEWTSHSVELLTKLAAALTPIEGQVLVMERKAFIPDGWHPKEHTALFLNHERPKGWYSKSDTTEQSRIEIGVDGDIEEFWNMSKSRKKEDWELDYSSSYTIHALSPHREARTKNCKDIDWDYVMERRSNYAIQIYPVLWEAVNSGFIDSASEYHK